MTQSVKIIVGDIPTKAEVIIDGQHVESNICKYTLEQNACGVPMLHLYVPVLKADIEIEKCEVKKHEINLGI